MPLFISLTLGVKEYSEQQDIQLQHLALVYGEIHRLKVPFWLKVMPLSRYIQKPELLDFLLKVHFPLPSGKDNSFETEFLSSSFSLQN
jgi:hypothetical protein